MYTYICLHIYIYSYTCLYMYIHTYIHKKTCVYLFIHLSIFIHIHLFIYLSIYLSIYIYISIYIYLFLSIYIYIQERESERERGETNVLEGEAELVEPLADGVLWDVPLLLVCLWLEKMRVAYMRIFSSIIFIYSFRGCVSSRVIFLSRVDALFSAHCSLNIVLWTETYAVNAEEEMSSGWCPLGCAAAPCVPVVRGE